MTAADRFSLPAAQRDELDRTLRGLLRDRAGAAQALREQRDRAREDEEGLLLSLLEVLDMLDGQIAFLDRGADELPPIHRRLPRNLGATRGKLLALLEARGVHPIPLEAGTTAIDYATCRVVAREEHPGAGALWIREVVKKGYRLRDRVLRPAEVVVVTGGTADALPP